MSRIYHIVNYLGYLAGFACVLMIAVAVYKILTGDEMEYRRYLTRIRNGLVALVLILTISTTKNLVLTYFPYTQSADAIGDFSSIKVTVTDGVLEREAKDKKGRWQSHPPYLLLYDPIDSLLIRGSTCSRCLSAV